MNRCIIRGATTVPTMEFRGGIFGYGAYGGYGGSFGSWGPWGGGYAGSVAVPYDEVTRMLMGTAIRYTEATDFDGRTESGEAWLPRKESITKDSSDRGSGEPVEK